MRNTFLDKRIPTILGLILILLGITVTSYLARTGVITLGNASPTVLPNDVRITNVTDTSFTVSYKTQEATSGVVAYGTDQRLGSTAGDDRDPVGKINSYSLHYITVKSLQPNTKYYFSVLSSSITYYNNGVPFEVTTGNALSPASEQQQLAGKILFPDGTTQKQAIVYAKTDVSQSVSVLTAFDGSYSLPLSSLRSADLASNATLAGQTLHVLFVADQLESSANVLASQANSVPTVILSKNYDFTVGQTPVTVSLEPAKVGFPVFTAASISGQKTPDILLPKKNESLTDDKPLFSGVASPGAEVQITIHSDPIETKVKASNAGQWSYRPIAPLEPGQHTITVTTKDQFGILKTVSQSFTVFAEGSQVNQSATPSATPTIAKISPTARPTPEPTQKITPTVFPTDVIVPTDISLPTPTITPFIFPTAVPPPHIASPGSSSATLWTITSLGLTTLGILLYLFGGKIL
jgi:hypothetical protein